MRHGRGMKKPNVEDDCRARKAWGLELVMEDGRGGMGPGMAK